MGWECKMCTLKQSLKNSYGQSTSAKDCRMRVQQLNQMRMELTEYNNEQILQQAQENVYQTPHNEESFEIQNDTASVTQNNMNSNPNEISKISASNWPISRNSENKSESHANSVCCSENYLTC